MTIQITWLGHACFSLELDGFSLLVDPFLDQNPVAPVKAADMHPNYILLTHGHGDHIADCASIASRTGATVICNPEIASWLRGQNVEHTHGQNLGGAYQHPFGLLRMTIAHHSSGLPDGSYGGNPAGFLLTSAAGQRLYIAGDTSLFMDMQLYGAEGIDLAILPIGDNYTMGPADALKALEYLRPRVTIPCHFNTWPVIAVDGAAWAAQVNAETAARAVLLKPGESYTLT